MPQHGKERRKIVQSTKSLRVRSYSYYLAISWLIHQVELKTHTLSTFQVDESLYPHLAALLKDRVSPISQTVPVSSPSILTLLRESCEVQKYLEYTLEAVRDARKLVTDEKAVKTGKTNWKVGTSVPCTPPTSWIMHRHLTPNPLTCYTGCLRVDREVVLNPGTRAGPAAGR